MEPNRTAFGLSSIAQIAVTVSDVPRATKFYRDTLGLPFLFDAAPGMSFFQAGDTRLMLGLALGDHPTRYSSIIYFRTDDIMAAHRALTERGVAFTHEPRIVHRGQKTDVWIAFFHDPDRNTLALMSETPRRE